MIACHGHGVPTGYFATPLVDTFSAYPRLWHRRLKERFPWAIFSVVTTAIGREDGDLANLLSWPNHPNRRGHELVGDELMRWIPFVLPAWPPLAQDKR
jgi:hypothetical protein